MPVVPNAVALAGIADGSSIVASDHRNNYAAVQTAVNALISALSAGSAGQVLSGAGTTVTWGGSYTAYTPAWTASGTAPAIGNAVVAGRYVQIGKLVHCYGSVAFGTTSTFGTGAYSFSLPVAAASSGATVISGMVDSVHSGGRAWATAILSTSTTFQMVYPTSWPGGAGQNFGQLAPWTWANGDTIFWNITYEAA